jgi:hypothetical protein
MSPAKRGRPTTYTEEQADDICAHLAEGKSLVSWCKEPGNASYRAVMQWLDANPAFAQKYARAREVQADFLAEEVVVISSTVLPAIKRTVSGRGKTRRTEEVHGDAVDRARLMVDARKWYAGKLSPKKYGDKIQTEHSGTIGLTGLGARMLERARQRGKK